MILGDAISRVANAYYVLWIQPAHLASIGFVWNPLPSLLELPFMIFAQIWRPLASSALAGLFWTAAFTAGSAVLIYNNCRHFKLSSIVTWGITLLFSLNPFIFIYGFNAMSEAFFIFFIILTCQELILWMEDKKQARILIIGLAMALAFLVRYEAVPLCFAVFCAVALIIFYRKKTQSPDFRSSYSYFEGTVITLFLPVVTAVFAWLIVSWVIVGNPLYFLNGIYSNASLTSITLDAVKTTIIGHPFSVFVYELEKMSPFLPVLIFIFLLRIWNKTFLKVETLILVLLAVSIPALHFFMLLRGSTFDYLRFYIYAFPVAMAWLPYELSKISGSKQTFKPILMAAAVFVMLFSACAVGWEMSNPKIAPEEQAYITVNQDQAQQEAVAQYLNTSASQGKILIDSTINFATILNIANPERIITNCSYDYKDAIESPQKFDVQYILTVPNTGTGQFNPINVQYPDLYEHGASWCTLVKDFNGQKLYKVN
jgi:4-amino-4-deoxy-L-arabinose transferase-like glycosyltransferase